MSKTPLLTALLVIVSTVACAGMTLEDYAEACGEWEDDYRSQFSAAYSSSSSMSSRDLSDLEEAMEEWNALSPPGEAKALHDITSEAVRLTFDYAEEARNLNDLLDDLQDELDDAPRSQRDDIRDEMDDLVDERQDLFDDLSDRLVDLSDDYEDELDDLPRSVERELEGEGCI